MDQLNMAEIEAAQEKRDMDILLTIMQGKFSGRIIGIARDAITEAGGFKVLETDRQLWELQVYSENTGRVTWVSCMWDLVTAFGGTVDGECELAQRLFLAYVGAGPAATA